MWTALSDVVRTYGSAGMAGLTLVAVMFIQSSSKNPEARKFASYSLLAALAVFFASQLVPPLVAPANKPDKANSGIVPPPIEAAKSQVFWVDAGISADWGGGDIASTTGAIAKYAVKNTLLCDENSVGKIATCWDSRPNGYPSVPDAASDVSGTPPQWCTYKEAAITLGTPPTGRAKAGRVYVCARAVTRPPS